MVLETDYTRCRKHERIACEGKLEISWPVPDGGVQKAKIDVVNVSYSGMQVASLEPIPVSAMVQVRGEVMQGLAWVRYSEQRGGSFLAGLNLVSGMNWSTDES